MPIAAFVNWLSVQASLGGRPLWFGDPLVEVVLVLLTACYLAGLFSQRGAARRAADPVSLPRMLAFFAGITVVAAALLSPMDALGDRFFSAHMAQHLLLIVGAAPLLAVSDAHLVLIAALPLRLRENAGRMPVFAAAAEWSKLRSTAWLAALLFVVTIWLWHVPAAHDFATDNGWAHAIEHLTILATATAFWRVVITSGKRRVTPGMGAFMVSLVGLSGALLSALIMFAPAPLCRAYVNNPIEDQVLAGLLMCIPASFVYLGSTIWALSRMLGDEARHAG
jgi:cytochrome c oxidase assembly factor CtaG